MTGPLSLVVSIATLLKLTANLAICISTIHGQVKLRPKVLEWLTQDLDAFQALLTRLKQLPEASEDRICDISPGQPQLPLQSVLNACLDLLTSLQATSDKLQKAFGEPSCIAKRTLLGQWQWRSSVEKISIMRK
ncbi:hypothetical protein F5B18DRAFT_595181 [Nemania serpens]|nr:hypothetical protein F5B18DRAFT_595181 [Nemania serpens]